MSVLPRSRPNRSRADILSVLEHYRVPVDRASLVFIRGYYLDSLGQPGVNDINLYDDAAFLISPAVFDAYNANTDPSFVVKKGKALAKLSLGRFTFYRGYHKRRYKALRAYPEGTKLVCTRNGVQSLAQYINIHSGGMSNSSAGVTWSEGCLTIPSVQYKEWQTRVWHEMDRYSQETIDMILVENRRSSNGSQQLFDEKGKVI